MSKKCDRNCLKATAIFDAYRNTWSWGVSLGMSNWMSYISLSWKLSPLVGEWWLVAWLHHHWSNATMFSALDRCGKRSLRQLVQYLNSGRCSKFFNLLAMTRVFGIIAIVLNFGALIIQVLVSVSPSIQALDIVRTNYGTGVTPNGVPDVTQVRVSLPIFFSLSLALIFWSVKFGTWWGSFCRSVGNHALVVHLGNIPAWSHLK